MKNTTFHEESVTIKCLECDLICKAVVQWWDNIPFASYCHECEHCGHMITESEFEVINE